MVVFFFSQANQSNVSLRGVYHQRCGDLDKRNPEVFLAPGSLANKNVRDQLQPFRTMKSNKIT